MFRDRTGIGCRAGFGAVAAAILTGSLALAEPVVLTARFSTRDAPEVVAVDHGPPGQNVVLDWMLPGLTADGGHALYVFASPRRGEDAGPPWMAWMNLRDGKLKEYYPGDSIRLRQDHKPDPLLGTATPAEPVSLTVPWPWGQPLNGAVCPDGRLFLALSPDRPAARRWPIVAYDPGTDTFEEWTVCDSQPVGMAYTDEGLWVLTADGRLYTEDILDGLAPVGRVPLGQGDPRGLMVDGDGVFYTACGPAPWRLWALRVSGNKIEANRLLDDMILDSLTFQPNASAPRCAVVVNENGRFVRRMYELRSGRAHPVDDTATWSATLGDTRLTLKTDFGVHPLTVGVRQADGPWRQFPLVFSRAARDRIKTLMAVPGGGGVYGAGWPTAWVWRFDPVTGVSHVFGSHYNIYDMVAWGDEIWVSAYFGIKLLRWRPDEAWTFDAVRHYSQKRYPGRESPWGDKDTSNPRLVCKFRFLKQLNVRRGTRIALSDNGLAWIGARTPASEHFHSRFSGAMNWYDPATETIGQVREPFLHHSVRDVSRAGPHHVVAAASQYLSPFEPLADDHCTGKFVVIDARTRDVVLDTSPLGSPLSYAAEGEAGRVVVYGGPGRYAGDGVRGAFFIFDINTMAVTHIVRLPVRLVWMEYDNATRFERGPDNRIYFYGRDDDGVALCRIDSLTGQVDTVLRGNHITNVATYNNTGAALAFSGDRVYFGARRLVSLPLETVIGRSGVNQ